MISDIVFQGGSVYTADKNRTIAQAAAVKNGKIVYVGDSAGAREYIGEETQVINLQGKTLLPSFFEGHCHYAAATNAVVGVNLAGMHTVLLQPIDTSAEFKGTKINRKLEKVIKKLWKIV